METCSTSQFVPRAFPGDGAISWDPDELIRLPRRFVWDRGGGSGVDPAQTCAAQRPELPVPANKRWSGAPTVDDTDGDLRVCTREAFLRGGVCPSLPAQRGARGPGQRRIGPGRSVRTQRCGLVSVRRRTRGKLRCRPNTHQRGLPIGADTRHHRIPVCRCTQKRRGCGSGGVGGRPRSPLECTAGPLGLG
ncbi:hypothetical protein NDU88_009144 [Pleurodeles waltl]|uniref:Uncharacterized protein n=1 Tax=Pleurodeles waltl TaxID=8319 RepID=A0AAV7PR94_PLEWA|nr:hypothetical protein NDU88_009144 [Pleurodeles waltl]